MSCDNLVHGKSAAYSWGDESGKYLYPNMSGHGPTCALRCKPDEQFVTEQ